MAVMIGDRALPSVDELSGTSALALRLVPGGTAWLAWAMSTSSLTWRFRDAEQLVCGVLSGLHGTDLLPLPRLDLLVGPLRLMSLPETDLAQLVYLAGHKEGEKGEIEALLRRHHLVPTSELQQVRKQLKKAGVPGVLAHGEPGLVALTDLYGLVSAEHDGRWRSVERFAEAAAFAAGRSTSLMDLVDLMRVWFTVTKRPGGPSPSQAVDHLAAGLFAHLSAPEIEALEAPAAVLERVLAWIDNGNQLGVRSVASGVRQLLELPDWERLIDGEAAPLANRYCGEATRFVRQADLLGAQLCQDGATARFMLQSNTHIAVLELDPHGDAVLRSYRRRKEEQPRSYAKEDA